METNTFNVSLSLQEAAELLDRGIIDGSITGERLGYHVVKSDDGCSCIVLVYEKHYFRAGNRLTLTICLDNMGKKTRVHAIGGGGGEGLFRFDWGASEDFTNAPANILRNYIV